MKGDRFQNGIGHLRTRVVALTGDTLKGLARWFCGVAFIAFAGAVEARDVYRYQDSEGRWRFSDRKPAEQHETIRLQSRQALPEPTLGTRKLSDGSLEMFAENPLWAPVYFQLRAQDKVLLEALVAPRAEQVLDFTPTGSAWRDTLSYRYYLGDPKATFDGEPLQQPVAHNGRFKITQGFGGRYSHTSKAAYHAIDIAMQVGDDILAARDGIVVAVKDDYPMGGKSDYFLDKANFIRVLHTDGSFTLYAHILLGSALVVEGQRVTAGDKLARCGSSGFSTGPHLHFAVQLPELDDRQWRSVPFRFQGPDGEFVPVVQQWLGRE